MSLFTHWCLLVVVFTHFRELISVELTPHSRHGSSESCQSNEAITSMFSFLNYVNRLAKDAQDAAKNSQEFKPMDCAEIQNSNGRSGQHQIWPRNRVIEGPVDVMCDMEDDGGGWTLIQRRGQYQNTRDYFYRDWIEYKKGFGSISQDFWIGNDVIYALTNQRACSIKVGVSDWEGNTTYATYDEFWISEETENYKLHVSGHRGPAGDSLKYHNGLLFSTKDRDHDTSDTNCATGYDGAWWFGECYDSNLNGPYIRISDNSTEKGIVWGRGFRGFDYSLKDSYMKLRPKNYEPNK